MRSAISLASDEEIISAMKQLEQVQALQQVHLMPVGGKDLQQLSSIEQMGSQKISQPGDQSINGLLNQLSTTQPQQPAQMQQTLQSVQMPPSLTSDSLNLQNILQNNVVQAASGSQGMQNTNPEFKKAIDDQTILIQEKLATEANTKLVQDLKTISAVIEQKQQIQNQINNSTQINTNSLITNQSAPIIDMIASASQQVDGYLTLGDQAQSIQNKVAASQTLEAILGQGSLKQEDNPTLQKQELMNSASQAIEGLIKIRAEKIASDAIQNNAVQQVVQQQQATQNPPIIQGLQDQSQMGILQVAQPRGQDIISTVSQPQSTILPVQISQNFQQDLSSLNSVAKDQQLQSQLQHITEKLQENIVKKLGETEIEKKKVPKQDKVLDFLASAGKISQISLAVTPLPTYLGVWNKPRSEQLQRVESISFNYLLMVIMSSAIWTSYAFKTQNIDLAIVSVIPLVITIILTAIYLSVKPESHLIKQFVGTVIVSQIFNFDLIPVTMCGMLGTLFSIAGNAVPLMYMPDVIQTRDVSAINMPLTCVNVTNLIIWLTIAIYIGDPFMTTSQTVGLSFNIVQLMFFFWAKKMITAQKTPKLWVFMRHLLQFFRLFVVQKNLAEFKSFFWLDENTQFAKTYIKQYQDDISDIQSQYSHNENVSYEQHMQNMRRINHKLKTLSDNGKRFKDEESGQNSYQSTEGGSSQQQTKQNFEEKNYIDHQNEDDEFVYENQYGQQFKHMNQNQYNQYNYNNDDFSDNSFNSSMNFAKLQNSINFRQSTNANMSESSGYFKSKLAANGMSNQRQGVSKINYNEYGNDNTIDLEDGTMLLGMGTNVPNTVKEESIEDEQSCRGGQAQDSGPRASVASILSAISQKTAHYEGDEEDEFGQNENQKFDDLRNRAQKLKNSKKSKKMEQNQILEQVQKQNTTIELDDLQKLTNQSSQEVNKSLDIKQGGNLNMLLPSPRERNTSEDDNLLSNRSSTSPRGEKKSDESKGNTTMSSHMNQFDTNSANPDQQQQHEEDDIMLKNL